MNKEFVQNIIEEKQTRFYDVADQIWDFAEPMFQEYKSSALLAELLRQEGFSVTCGISGMPTAFRAEFGSGKPVIGFLGEYDALSGLAQAADVPEKEGIQNTSGCGHGCGHNLLGAACAQAAVAVKDYLKESGQPGKIIFFGCPAEEGGSGKAFMVRDEQFSECDICLTWHPFDHYSGSLSSLASARVIFAFDGVSSHAAFSPHLGRSALDAVELMNVGVNYLREHVTPDTRMHYAVIDSGGMSPNVVQAHAEVLYSLRTATNDQIGQLLERVKNIAEGAALMTGTQVHAKIISACADVVQNKTLDHLLYRHLCSLVPLTLSQKELEYASQFSSLASPAELKTYQSIVQNHFPERMEELMSAPFAQVVQPAGPEKTCSTDVGDVSWVVPTSWFYSACYALGTPVHSWKAVAEGKSEIAHRGMKLAATVLALSAIEAMETPSVIEQARKDWQQALAGRVYQCNIPPEVTPALK